MKLLYFISFSTLIYAIPRDEDDGRAISLFNVVKFKNDACPSTSTLTSSSSGTGHRNGTCLTENECHEKNGIASGGCAQGFGVCCVFILSNCASIVTQNCTYVRNPGFPSAIDNIETCKFTIHKSHSSVCLLRLDFEAFSTIRSPTDTLETAGGSCTDTFIASSATTGDTTPTICGENGGQHIYLDIGEGEFNQGVLDFNFDTSASAVGRSFEIKVSQIKCESPNRPPSGCLQYHVGTDGRITTFNFAGTSGHLADQRYNICLRLEKGFCCVKYQVCTDAGAYTLHNSDLDADPTTNQGSLAESSCLTDYIIIEGSASTCDLTDTNNRYCGERFADSNGVLEHLEICDCTPPHRVTVVTDNTNFAETITPTAESATVLSQGLCLTYTQIAC